MKNQSFNIVIRKEDNFFVSRVLENSVSSFGESENECILNTKEALQLYYEGENFKNDKKIKQAHLKHMELQYA